MERSYLLERRGEKKKKRAPQENNLELFGSPTDLF